MEAWVGVEPTLAAYETAVLTVVRPCHIGGLLDKRLNDPRLRGYIVAYTLPN